MRIEDKKVLSELCKDWVETGIIVDFLEDADATIGDVLSLYAGRPPHWVDGLYKPILDEFLLRKDRPDRACAVASSDDGSPRSLVPHIKLVLHNLPGTVRNLVEGRKLYPTGWQDLSQDAISRRGRQRLHCHGCSESIEVCCAGVFGIYIDPLPAWWPVTYPPQSELNCIRAAAFCCPNCDAAMLFFNPHQWWPIRGRKHDLMNLFSDVTVPCLKSCRCQSNSMMFLPCRTCNGNGWYIDGEISAHNLIPPATKF